MNSIADIAKRLEAEALAMEEIGQSEFACGLIAGANIVLREFGGELSFLEPAPQGDTEPVALADVDTAGCLPEVGEALLMAAFGALEATLGCPYCRATGKTKGMFYWLDCLHCGGSALVGEVSQAAVADLFRLAARQQSLIAKLVAHSHPVQARSQAELVDAFYADCRSNYRGD